MDIVGDEALSRSEILLCEYSSVRVEVLFIVVLV